MSNMETLLPWALCVTQISHLYMTLEVWTVLALILSTTFLCNDRRRRSRNPSCTPRSSGSYLSSSPREGWCNWVTQFSTLSDLLLGQLKLSSVLPGKRCTLCPTAHNCSGPPVLVLNSPTSLQNYSTCRLLILLFMIHNVHFSFNSPSAAQGCICVAQSLHFVLLNSWLVASLREQADLTNHTFT